MTIEPSDNTKMSEILRRAGQGETRKTIAQQTGFDYVYVGTALYKLRKSGRLAKSGEVWTDEVLEALRAAIVVDGLKGDAATRRLTERFNHPFTRNQVVNVALRRGWRSGGVDAAASLSKKKPRWRDAPVAALRAAIAEELSGSEAAARLTQMFGVSYSRNMAISKAKSLGLQFVSEAKNPCGSRGPRTERRPSRAVSKPAAPIAFLDAEETWAPRRVTLLALREGDCKFPLGDPRADAFAFCGAPTPPGKVYCGHCARVAYEPPAQRAKARKKWREDRGLPVGREWNGRQGSSA